MLTIPNADSEPYFERRLEALSQAATGRLVAQGHGKDSISFARFLNMRYEGTDFALMCAGQKGDGGQHYRLVFMQRFVN